MTEDPGFRPGEERGMEQKDREGRDAAGVGPYAREREQLVAMSTLQSWTVSAGEPDIRGWEVRTVAGRQLGAVSDLLIDQKQGEVVLLDVDLPGTDQHTFVPIRVVEIDRAKRLVVMDSADLPESALERDDRGTVVDASSPSGIVRYPMADREVRSAPPELADTVPAPDSTAKERIDRDRATRVERDEANERRRLERRRIERLNTEF